MSRPHVFRGSAARYIAVVLGMLILAAAAAELNWPLLPATAIVVFMVPVVRSQWLWDSDMHGLDEFFARLSYRVKTALRPESN